MNKEYSIIVDNILYNINIKDIEDFINKGINNYYNIINDSKIKTLYNIPKYRFIYIVEKYLEESKTNNNMLNIIHNSNIDKVIDKCIITKDNYKDKIKINKDLEKYILSNMNNKYNDLEKSIYIYIKLCKALTYDEVYYASNSKINKHENIKDIKNINKNSNVVCWEFNAIYTYFLNKLNIKYTTDYGRYYGDHHPTLTYRIDDLLVNVDATKKILDCDMAKSKYNEKLEGLTPIGLPDARNRFNNTYNNIYNSIKKEDKTIYNINELLKEYNSLSNIESINIYNKLNIIKDIVEYKDLSNIETLSYFKNLKNNILGKDKKKVTFEVVSKSNKLESIITINNDNNYDYYYYIPKHNIEKIDKEELQEEFNNKELSYLRSASIIPGITSTEDKLIERGLK